MAHLTDVESNRTVDTAGTRELRLGEGVYGVYLKRLFDIAVVVAALPIVMLFVFVLALFVRRDGGPAFYVQERVGRDGRIFRLWKLRTMVVDAEWRLSEHLTISPQAQAEWARTQKLKNDPRITRLGRILRRTSLDELPQLWNVLRGDMSLVGPRPMMPSQRPLYPDQAYYRLRPGLTGFWQTSDRNETSFAGRAAYDTAYANELSFVTDVRVILRTVQAMLRGTGY